MIEYCAPRKILVKKNVVRMKCINFTNKQLFFKVCIFLILKKTLNLYHKKKLTAVEIIDLLCYKLYSLNRKYCIKFSKCVQGKKMLVQMLVAAVATFRKSVISLPVIYDISRCAL